MHCCRPGSTSRERWRSACEGRSHLVVERSAAVIVSSARDRSIVLRRVLTIGCVITFCLLTVDMAAAGVRSVEEGNRTLCEADDEARGAIRAEKRYG
jgi:hypothetical protein